MKKRSTKGKKERTGRTWAGDRQGQGYGRWGLGKVVCSRTG